MDATRHFAYLRFPMSGKKRKSPLLGVQELYDSITGTSALALSR